MKQLYKISDEELAAYLDEMPSKEDSLKVDTEMDVDTFEILSVSRKAIEEFSTDNIISLPPWDGVMVAPFRHKYEPLAMAGFLGERYNTEDEIYDEKEDKENE